MMNEWDVIARIFVALIAGGLVGVERTYHGRAAGLRTYALVAFGSALGVAAAQYDLFGDTRGGGDPTRVIQGIVTGIGFLGAGVIVKEGFSVRGLTTAASIWVVSAIGVVIGAGMFLSGAAASAAHADRAGIAASRRGPVAGAVFRALLRVVSGGTASWTRIGFGSWFSASGS